jgi:hypothetical protein
LATLLSIKKTVEKGGLPGKVYENVIGQYCELNSPVISCELFKKKGLIEPCLAPSK